MELLIEYYKSKNIERNKEYLECIKKNIENIYIEKIHVFIDESDTILDITSPKLKIIRLEKRYTYKDFITYANTFLSDKKVILANTDIYFDDTLSIVRDFNFKSLVLALTRWEIRNGKSELYYVDMSQDAWIFKGDLKIEGGDFFLGKPGCDNHFAYLLHISSYDVRNPSQQIKIYHLHNSNYRTYTVNDTVKGNYMTLLPNNNIANPTYKKIVENF